MKAAPYLGCRKITIGEYHQIFDAEGNCIDSKFVAYNDSDSCEYKDDQGCRLHEDDSRVDFYSPFYTIIS